MLGTKKYKTKNGTVFIVEKGPLGYRGTAEVLDEENNLLEIFTLYYDLNGNSLTDPDWDLIEGILPKPT
jgi:hypothetical protein